ncbi:MAG: hypothetical protein KJ069_16015 [Anaerolineae bacterium]|nr:hypothetical protein [Anaerolineae bacterium]
MSGRSWWSVGLIGFFLLTLVSATVAQNATPTLTVATEDSPLIIQGRLDGQTSSFSGNVRLTVTGSDAAALLLLASDLAHDSQPAWQIDRSSVSIPAGINLSDGQPQDMRVTINNAHHPGVYTGALKFMLPGQTEAEALVIPLELRLNAVPKVVPLMPALSWQVANCNSWLDCRLATMFLPESVVQDVWDVWLDNQTPQAVEVSDRVAILQGAANGRTTQPNQVMIAVPHTLPANQPAPIPVTINRQQLAPDSYQGTLRFTIEGATEPLSIPTTLAVRQGPLWALVVVLLGILLGRLVRDMETPIAQTQVRLIPEYLRLRAAADGLKEAEDRVDALAQLAAFKQRLDRGKETEDVLSSDLTAIEARIQFYASLEALAADLPAGLKDRLAPQFMEARRAVRDGRQQDAERCYTEIESAIKAATEDQLLGSGKRREAFERQLGALQASVKGLATAVSVRTTSIGLRLLARLSGIRLNADVRFWIVRPIISLVLLVLLVLWGMQALYVNAGTTFGAAGVYDYTALLLWGLTADVVSRSLSNMPTRLDKG